MSTPTHTPIYPRTHTRTHASTHPRTPHHTTPHPPTQAHTHTRLSLFETILWQCLCADVGTTLAEKRQLGLSQQAASPIRAAVQTVEAALPEPQEAEGAREFDELMDTFSLHHFIIRFGATLDTPEYISFQRKYSPHWGALQQLVTKLEAMMTQYNVPLAYIDGQKLAALALDPLAPQDEPALLNCVVNTDQVLGYMSQPGQRFKGSSGGRNDGDTRTIAAIELQAGFRGGWRGAKYSRSG